MVDLEEWIDRYVRMYHKIPTFMYLKISHITAAQSVALTFHSLTHSLAHTRTHMHTHMHMHTHIHIYTHAHAHTHDITLELHHTYTVYSHYLVYPNSLEWTQNTGLVHTWYKNSFSPNAKTMQHNCT